jgi:hypothetical protein
MARPYLLMSHLDYHNPDDSLVGEGFDAAAFARQLAMGGVDAIYAFAKCHYGNSYYPTKVGRPHPRLRRDLLGDIVEACHGVGVGAIAYVSGMCDNYAARAHPDWRHLDAQGQACQFSAFDHLCAFGPYADESLIPQLAELAAAYPLDGLFVDTMSMFDPCYCEHCQQRFLEETGSALPRSPEEEAWRLGGRTRRRWSDELHRKAARAVHAIRPSLPFGFNQSYGAREATEPPAELDYFTADVRQEDYQAVTLGCQGRYLSSLGRPFELMVGRFWHGLGDWTVRSPEALSQQAAVVTALGGRFAIIDRQFPDGSLDPANYRVVAQVSAFLRERADLVTDTELAAGGVLILNGADAALGPEWSDYGLEISRTRLASPYGAHRALADWGEAVTLVGQHRLVDLLPLAAALVLPEQGHLSPALLPWLREFLVGGGLVIASHPLGLPVTELRELFGVAVQGEEPWGYGYLDGGGDEPLLVHGQWGRYEATGAEVLGWLRRPVGEPGARYGHGVAPYRPEAAGPGLTVRCHGRGAAVLVAGPVFSSHFSFHNPAVPRLLRRLLRQYARTTVEMEAPPQVQVVLRRKQGRLLVHLVNVGGERVISGWPTLDDIRPVLDIAVKLRGPKPKEVLAQPGGERLAFSYKRGQTLVRLPRLDIHRCLEVIG